MRLGCPMSTPYQRDVAAKLLNQLTVHLNCNLFCEFCQARKITRVYFPQSLIVLFSDPEYELFPDQVQELLDTTV